MARFKVIRKSVRWNRKTYHAGEYLPESFTEKDMYRVLYPSRIQKEEVAKVEKAVQEKEVEKPVQPKVSTGTKSAKSTPVAPTKTTGAPISGAKVIAKTK